MDEKDYFFIGEGGVNPGYLEITRQGENLPVLKTQGSIEVNPDEKRFLFEGENVIFKTGTNAWPIPEDRSMISGTVPMVFESQDRKVVGLIPDIADKRFYWTTQGGKVAYGPVSGITEEQLGVELPDFITKSWAENSEVTQDRAKTISAFANNPEFQEVYKESIIADKTLHKYVPDVKGFEPELSALKESGKDSSISWEEVEKRIGSKKVGEIKSTLKNRAKLYYTIYSELSKEKDLKDDIDKLKIEDEILKVLGKNELKALNECISRGNLFDLCFDKNYKYLGSSTIKCITDSEYCKTMTSYQFNKMRIK